MTRVLGLDPGSGVAIAVLTEAGELPELHDMPALCEAAGRPATNVPLRAAIVAKTHGRAAYCEWVSVCPTDARTAAFAFGRLRVIEGVTAALGLPIAFLTPLTWNQPADVPPGVENKDIARARAIARWPARAELFARKRDIDRAEAALIGWAGIQLDRQPGGRR